MSVLRGGTFIFTGEVGINNEVVIEDVPSNIDSTNVSDSDVIHESDSELKLLNKQAQAFMDKSKQEAELEAASILEYARMQSEEILAAARIAAQQEAEHIYDSAKNDGFVAGYDEGLKEGIQKGYTDERTRVSEEMSVYLNAVNQLLNDIKEQKDSLINGYEDEIFQLVFDIAQKVTLDSLTAKDKNVVRKIIKQAAKGFRSSQYLKISLNAGEFSQDIVADEEFISEIAKMIPHVELEVLKDSPNGTVLLDNGSEITDASIATQLKMIEELGRGKFKNMPKDNAGDA